MDLNPANWTEDDRSLMVITWVFFQIIQMISVCMYMEAMKTRSNL